MKRSRFLTLSAIYLAANVANHGAIADDTRQNIQRDSQRQSANDAIAITPASPMAGAEITTSSRLAGEFATLAGSQENAEKLVAGLRNAKPVVMKTDAPLTLEVSFSPPTRPLNFSDIYKALSLAQAQLTSKNINKPTPAQLTASLTGGELPNANGDVTRVIGILPLHQRGMSWDQIARALHVALPKRVVGTQDAVKDRNS
jgi:hypothetical protein